MSRSGDKKPVGFATHVTAGGIAGACEAVRLSTFAAYQLFSLRDRFLAGLPTSRHHQSPDATLQVRTSSRGESQPLLRLLRLKCADKTERFSRDRCLHCQTGNSLGLVQGSRGRSFRDCTKNGHSFCKLRDVQGIPVRQADR